jgi:lipid-A-disaccharide synthase-like uncharacterized protein
MMEWLDAQLWKDGHFLWWEIIGWLGTAIFGTRFFVQWYATEKKKRVVIPITFWWLSLAGSILLLTYAIIAGKGLVIIISYAFNWIPYVRTLIIHHRHADAQITCRACHAVCPPNSNFCFACGARLNSTPVETPGRAAH